MNLNELKKHVYFNIILYIFIGLCFLISIIAILVTPVSAAELKTYEITSGVKNTTNCGSASLGFYCWGQGSSLTTWSKTQFGSTNGYAVNDLAFDLNGTITYQSSPTTIEIYSPTNSFKNTTYTCYWGGNNQPSSCTVYRASSNHININFVSGLSSPQYLYVSIGNTEQTSTWLDNISINKIIANQSVNDPNASVIQNQNENTAELINTQNENTQTLFDRLVDNSIQSINNERQQLSNMCSNIYYTPINIGKTIDSGGNLSDDPLGYYSIDYIDIALVHGTSNDNRICIKNPESSRAGYYFAFYTENKSFISLERTSNRCVNIPSNAVWFRFGSYVSDTTILRGSNDCVKAEDKIYDYVTNDSDPTVNQQGINNALSSVDYSNPLDYLLTLPTHLLQKINTVLSANSCSRVSFGSLYGTELYLPCIDFASLLGSNIWNTIDLFVGVGLLVMVIKHFYETISNIITLGKEKEVQGKLDLPTPMQFLAGILGGGRS